MESIKLEYKIRKDQAKFVLISYASNCYELKLLLGNVMNKGSNCIINCKFAAFCLSSVSGLPSPVFSPRSGFFMSHLLFLKIPLKSFFFKKINN